MPVTEKSPLVPDETGRPTPAMPTFQVYLDTSDTTDGPEGTWKLGGGPGGAGGGDASAAKQDLQQLALDDILAGVGGPNDAAAATEASDASQNAVLKAILRELRAEVTSIAHFALDATSDLTPGSAAQAEAGEEEMVAAGAAGVTHRLHRYCVIVPGAGTLEIRNGPGGSVLRRHRFPAAGLLDRPFDPRPYATTSAATPLTLYWSGTGTADIDFDYKSS